MANTEFLFVIYQVVKVALDVHTNENAGDILVFLTGGDNQTSLICLCI